MQLLAAAELPDVIQGYERGVSLVFLPRVDGVPNIGEIFVSRMQGKDRDQSWHVGETVVPDAKQSEPMLARVEHSLTIEFVLLPMFEPGQESVAVGSCEGDPRVGRGA